MEDLNLRFPLGEKVITPVGFGEVVGYLNRNEYEQVLVKLLKWRTPAKGPMKILSIGVADIKLYPRLR